MLPPVDELFSQYGAAVFRRCRQMLRNDALAEDAVQEVFVRVLQKRESFRGDASVFTWLYRVATTYCLQQLRNAKRRDAKLEGLAVEASVTEAPVERLSVRRVLDETDEALQAILYMRFIDGMTLDEVAEVAQLTRKTVARHIELFNEKARTTLDA